MFTRKLELVSTKNLDNLYISVSKKYNISKSKLKVMWSDRENNSFQEVNPRLKRGKVLDVLMQLKVTEKIIRINDHYVHPTSGFIFDPISRKVIARIVQGTPPTLGPTLGAALEDSQKNQNQQVRQLTESDIIDCRQWKFDHDIPVNLDKTTDLEREIDQIHLGDSESEEDD